MMSSSDRESEGPSQRNARPLARPDHRHGTGQSGWDTATTTGTKTGTGFKAVKAAGSRGQGRVESPELPKGLLTAFGCTQRFFLPNRKHGIQTRSITMARGGARPGAGRKRKSVSISESDTVALL